MRAAGWWGLRGEQQHGGASGRVRRVPMYERGEAADRLGERHQLVEFDVPARMQTSGGRVVGLAWCAAVWRSKRQGEERTAL